MSSVHEGQDSECAAKT